MGSEFHLWDIYPILLGPPENSAPGPPMLHQWFLVVGSKIAIERSKYLNCNLRKLLTSL